MNHISTGSRRHFLASAATATLAAATLPAAPAQAQSTAPSAAPAAAASTGAASVTGTEHWATKRAGNQNIRLFVWNKKLCHPAEAGGRSNSRGTILFVHGSPVSSTPVFDLQIPGRASSTMDWFACLGYDTWC